METPNFGITIVKTLDIWYDMDIQQKQTLKHSTVWIFFREIPGISFKSSDNANFLKSWNKYGDATQPYGSFEIFKYIYLHASRTLSVCVKIASRIWKCTTAKSQLIFLSFLHD